MPIRAEEKKRKFQRISYSALFLGDTAKKTLSRARWPYDIVYGVHSEASEKTNTIKLGASGANVNGTSSDVGEHRNISERERRTASSSGDCMVRSRPYRYNGW